MKRKTLPTITVYKNSFRCSGTFVLSNQTTERFQAIAKTREEAYEKWKAKAEERNYEIQYGERKKEGNITLHDAIRDKIEEFKTCPRENRKGEILLRDSTLNRMEQILKNQIDNTDISRKLVKDITPKDMMEWKLQMNAMKSNRGKPLSSSVKLRAYNLIRDVMEEYRPYDNPLINFKIWHQKTNKRTKNNVLFPEEIKHVIKYCEMKMHSPKTKMDSTYASVTLIMLYCYPRPGEIYGLECRDWHCDTGILDIHRTGKYEDGRLKNMESYREIYPPDAAINILNEWCRDRKPEEKIFSSLSGRIISDSAYRTWLLKMLTELKIEKDHFSPHKMRGTGISYALYLNIPLEVVSKNAGHTDISTTLGWYVNTYKERQKESAKLYNNEAN